MPSDVCDVIGTQLMVCPHAWYQSAALTVGRAVVEALQIKKAFYFPAACSANFSRTCQPAADFQSVGPHFTAGFDCCKTRTFSISTASLEHILCAPAAAMCAQHFLLVYSPLQILNTASYVVAYGRMWWKFNTQKHAHKIYIALFIFIE